MPPSPPTQKMGDRHERHLAEVFGGARTRASGSKWFDQGDVRNNHDEPFAFCVDGKSTLGKSISVTREMLGKIREQAQGERPAIGLRFYGNPNLDDVDEDWAAMRTADLEEVLPAARAYEALRAALGPVPVEEVTALVLKAGMVEGLRRSLADAHQALASAEEAIARRDIEIAALRDQASAQSTILAAEGARHLPQLPWAVIRLFSQAETAARSAAQEPPRAGVALDYAADGTLRTYTVKTVRVERSMGNRPKVMVDDVQVRNADVLKPEGSLFARAWQDNPSAEVG